jgi:hypothetical protein
MVEPLCADNQPAGNKRTNSKELMAYFCHQGVDDFSSTQQKTTRKCKSQSNALTLLITEEPCASTYRTRDHQTHFP